MLEKGRAESPRAEIERRAAEFGGAMGGWLRALAKEGFNHQDQLSEVTEQSNALLAKVGELEERLDAVCKDLYGRTDAPQDPGPAPQLPLEQPKPAQERKLAPPTRRSPKRRTRTDMLQIGLVRGDRLYLRGSEEEFLVAGPQMVKWRGKLMRPSNAVAELCGVPVTRTNAFRVLHIEDGRSVFQLRLDWEAEQAAKEESNG